MIVSLTAHERPDTLAQVIKSLETARQHLAEPAVLVARVEPSHHRGRILNLLNLWGGPTLVAANSRRLGLQANTLAVLTDAWAAADTYQEDFVLHLEDDLLVAPDGLRLAAWMRDQYRDSPTIPYVTLTQVHARPGPGDYLTVTTSGWFECHVWGTWRSEWATRLLPAWPHEWPNHWAARVNETIMDGRLQAAPVLSRSRSIGVTGQHCTPELHERHNPTVYAADVTVPAGPYRHAAAAAPL